MSIKNVSVKLASPAVRGILGVFVVFVLFVVPGGVPFTASLRAEIIEQILVKVNGEIFTKTDLEQRQVLVLRQRGQQIDLKADPNNQQLRKALDEITPGLMVDVVNEMVIVQRGKELGYSLSNEQFKTVVDNIKKENKIETEEQFQAALKSENMSMADLRRSLERSMIRQRVEQNEVLGKIGVSESEARGYYESHQGEFTTPQTVTLREILILVPSDNRGVNAAADDAAKARAAEIRTRVTSGKESFEKLAAELSESPSKANGGLIGPLSILDISADLRKVVDSLKPGDVSDPIRAARGYQILKLETKSEAQTMPFDQARQQISERVFTDKRKAEYMKYLEKLRAQAIIEWKNPDVKKAFEEGLKQPAAATP
ncbi:MAG TPA: peptidyl-prolyl cis-trans isomerase [Vicinamibacterales bacterium]|nr:peptidyl-prolyl cis-trans isomerase [Vicinamibacterales bacterium]